MSARTARDSWTAGLGYAHNGAMASLGASDHAMHLICHRDSALAAWHAGASRMSRAHRVAMGHSTVARHSAGMWKCRRHTGHHYRVARGKANVARGYVTRRASAESSSREEVEDSLCDVIGAPLRVSFFGCSREVVSQASGSRIPGVRRSVRASRPSRRDWTLFRELGHIQSVESHMRHALGVSWLSTATDL